MPIMPLLSSRLLTTWITEASCSSDTSSFIRSLLGGVLLLLEFLSRFSYLAKRSRKFISSVSFLRVSRFRAFMLRFNLIISAYCWLTVQRNNRISFVIPCNTFDVSVTCSFIGIKMQRKSEIRKKDGNFYNLYTKILEERILTNRYRWIVTARYACVTKAVNLFDNKTKICLDSNER